MYQGEVGMADGTVFKSLQINGLVLVQLASELHLYQWPGTAARS